VAMEARQNPLMLKFNIAKERDEFKQMLQRNRESE
jgi:hypothetical protein